MHDFRALVDSILKNANVDWVFGRSMAAQAMAAQRHRGGCCQHPNRRYQRRPRHLFFDHCLAGHDWQFENTIEKGAHRTEMILAVPAVVPPILVGFESSKATSGVAKHGPI